MRLVASDFYLLHNPSFCERRVYLDQRDIPKPPPSPFQQLLFELGKRHERNHLATLGTYAEAYARMLSGHAQFRVVLTM